MIIETLGETPYRDPNGPRSLVKNTIVIIFWPYSIRVEYLFRNQGIQVRILLRPPTKFFEKNVKIIAKFVIYYCWKQQADL